MVRRRKVEQGELNLAPLIDIFANMLFFLMTTVTFLTLKTLNAAVPAMAKPGEKVDTTTSVSVSIQILEDGYAVSASGQPPNSTKPMVNITKSIPRKSDGVLDTKRLTAELWEIKKIADDQKVVMIFPEAKTSFQDVVSTMDASREMPSIIDSTKRVMLFPRPVLSELEK